LFSGKEAKAAASSLLAAAEEQAGSGSWELIGVGRVYYLSGDKEKGQAIFNRVTAKKLEKSDVMRIGRVYQEAGEWDKAAIEFQRVLTMDAKDDSGMAEIGAYYNLHKDRAKAEELFSRNNTNVWNTLAAAGSYLGVNPVP